MDFASCSPISIAFSTRPMVFIASPENPLARKKRLDWPALAGETLLIREAGSGTRSTLERYLDEQTVRPARLLEMSSNETIKQAVMAGMGLSFLSLRTVRHELASGHIVLLDIVGLPHIGHWYITHRAQKKLAPAAMAFKEFVIEQAGPRINVWA